MKVKQKVKLCTRRKSCLRPLSVDISSSEFISRKSSSSYFSFRCFCSRWDLVIGRTHGQGEERKKSRIAAQPFRPCAAHLEREVSRRDCFRHPFHRRFLPSTAVAHSAVDVEQGWIDLHPQQRDGGDAEKRYSMYSRLHTIRTTQQGVDATSRYFVTAIAPSKPSNDTTRCTIVICTGSQLQGKTHDTRVW